MDPVEVGDHLAVDGGDPVPGVYRVVGTDDGSVTALRVGDADGRRVHTGEVVTVDRDELDGFIPTEAPDGGRSLVASLMAVPGTLHWSVRALATQLRARPLSGAVALALFVAGTVGGPVLPVPELVLDAMVLLGGFGLAAIGTGRL